MILFGSSIKIAWILACAGMTAICGDIQPMALSRLDRYKVIEDICL